MSHQKSLLTIVFVVCAAVVTTLAGSGALAWADGLGTAASFNDPYGVSVDSKGAVYVADSDNNRIRKVLSSGGYRDRMLKLLYFLSVFGWC